MFRIRYRVIYGDTDKMGVVYHSNYFRFFERARTEFMRKIDLPYGQVENMGVGFPLVECSCKYRRPIGYDELITIELFVDQLTRKRIDFSYKIYNEKGELSAEGTTIHLCVGRDGKTKKMPEELYRRLQNGIERLRSG